MKAVLATSIVALAGAACLSCTSSFTPTEVIGASSGTRLRAWVEEGDGVRVFDGWHDTSLDLDCEFRTATDGRLRCLPAWSRSQMLYADRDCATPAFIESWPDESVAAEPRWMFERVPGPAVCGGVVASYVHEVRVMGEVIPAPAPETIVYFRNGVAEVLCSSRRAPDPLARHHAVGAFETPETFVAATRVDEPRSGVFDQSVIVAEDGARQVEQLVNRATGDHCSGLAIRGQERCVPASGVQGDSFSFADAACTVPVGTAYAWGDDECLPPRLFVAYDFATECATIDAYAVGEPASGSFLSLGGMCIAFGAFDGGRVFDRGAELTDSALDAVAPSLTRASVGAGALRASVWVDADGAPLMSTDRPWHMADGRKCVPQDHAGARVCGPAATANYYFADAACTVPLVPPYYFCDDPAPTVAVVPSEDAFREVGAEYTGTDVYFGSHGGACGATGGSRSGYRTLGAVTTRTFPAMSRHLE